MRCYFFVAALLSVGGLFMPSAVHASVPIGELTQKMIQDRANLYFASHKDAAEKVSKEIGVKIILKGDQIFFEKSGNVPKKLEWKYELDSKDKDQALTGPQKDMAKVELKNLITEILNQFKVDGETLLSTEEWNQVKTVFDATPWKRDSPPPPPPPPPHTPTNVIVVFVAVGWHYSPCTNSWMMVGSLAAFPAPAVDGTARAKVRIEIPNGGKLFVGDQHIDVAPGSRIFETPPLAVGQLYFYDFRIETEHDGQARKVSRRVIVRGGEDAVVSFPAVLPNLNDAYAERSKKAPKQLIQKQHEEVRDDYPKEAKECYTRGCAAYRDRNYSVARAYFNQAVRLNENDARFWYFKAFSEVAMDNYELAVVSVGRARKLQASGMPANDQIDLALRQLPESARELLESVPSAAPMNPKALAAQR